jgi:signal transduction histidine kinase
MERCTGEMTQSRLIGIAGLLAGLIVGVPALLYHAVFALPSAPTPVWRSVGWFAAFLLFGLLFGLNLRRASLLFLALESVAAVTLVLLRCNGYEASLLVLVAIQLGTLLDLRHGMLWVCTQTLLLGAAMAAGWSIRSALLMMPPYLGFQLVAFLAFYGMAHEAAGKAALATANAELRAVQQILADSSRMAERLRISHELHDALGHRLTALTLNLEAAIQQTQGPAKANVELARALARDLLSDVREIVADFQARDGVHLSHALQTLMRTVPQPKIHLEIDESLRVGDPEQAHILLRCAQEIVTNAARHSGAQNLWIVVEQQGDAFRIRAHDDGRGREEARDGFGLRGMRERLERAGGELRVATEPGRGFDVSALLPIRQGAV